MSLSDALRAAALERAKRSGQTVDGVVLEPSGVIDLREMARAAGRENERRIKLPLLTGRTLDDRDDDTMLTETALWRRLRPVLPSTEPTQVDLTGDEPVVDLAPTPVEPAPAPDADLVPLPELDPFDEWLVELSQQPGDADPIEDPGFDATLADDAGRPVAVCDRCGSFGQRDLLDRFSSTGYYSCDDCGHMWQQPEQI